VDVTPQDLQNLVDYHYWARDRMLEALDPLTPEQYARAMGSSFGSIRDTAVHIYAAEWVWYSRWQGSSPTAMPSGEEWPDVPSLRAAWSGQERKLRAFVDSLGEAGPGRVFEYAAFNGQPSRSTFEQMLQHLVNHGSYHRGQITTMLRQIGAKPAKSMDLIAFYRTKTG
jgi:uncharacterized damage-inducible protein DinB